MAAVALLLGITACNEKLSMFEANQNPPEVTDFSPKNGVAGTEISITGANLQEVDSIKIGGVKTDVKYRINRSLVIAGVTNEVVSGIIEVFTPYGSIKTSESFTMEYVIPELTGYVNKSRPYTVVGLTGENLDIVTGVLFGTKEATVVTQTREEIEVEVPYFKDEAVDIVLNYQYGTEIRQVSTFSCENHDEAWRNGCVSDTYEPGSVFKIITAGIALEEDVVSLDDRFYCPGYITVEDRRIHCHKRTGHGSETFVQGIQNSCNPVFIDLGLRIGSERYYADFKRFGLLDKTGIDLPGEAATIMHQPDKIGQVELATISFGQSFQLTPIELMTTVSSLINGGNRITPHIGKEIHGTEGTVKEVLSFEQTSGICSEETSDTLRKLLEGVVAEGSGKNAKVEGYAIGGKTATSQTLPRSDNVYIASFLGFYPVDDPALMVLVKINNPKGGAYYGGTIAAPVAAEIFREIIPYAQEIGVCN